MSAADVDTGIFEPVVGPWYQSLRDPRDAQNQTLLTLVKGYQKTRYGTKHRASSVTQTADYRGSFPTIDYRKLTPYLAEIRKGNHDAFLPDPLACWVMTRGSTGPAKVLPATQTHIEQIFMCGARALANHIVRSRNLKLLDGKVLNLNLPSAVHTITIDGHPATYGYSSGTYAKLIPTFGKIGLLPRQEDIDTLGPGITRQDWEQRFELAYQQALSENVTAAMGVTPVILSFARYVKRKHGKKPSQLWNLQALFCTSVRKIPFKYGPVLRKYFGQVPIVEIYSATEGVFAQQLDDLPYVTPNYDTYFFEVDTGRETKMLHELKRGEWGKLIISTCMFPRYDIGDMIEAAGNGYFRVFGRRTAQTLLEHRLYRLFLGWLT